MDNRVLEILFYLMDRLHEAPGRAASLNDVAGDLKGLGYSDDEINSAYAWLLEHGQGATETLYSDFPSTAGSSRILTELERSRFVPDAYSFLVRTVTVGLIDPEQLEAILDRVAVLGQRPVTLSQLKLLVSLIAFGGPDDLNDPELFGDMPRSVDGIN